MCEKNFTTFFLLLTVLVSSFAHGASIESKINEKGVISSITGAVSTIVSIANPPKCNASTPINLAALQAVLPPSMASLVTQENLEAIQGIANLAQLSTSAATGNPIAIAKLILLLASKDSPIPPAINLGKQIVGLLSPAELAAAFPQFSGAVGNEITQIQQFFNGLKPSANVTVSGSATAPAA